LIQKKKGTPRLERHSRGKEKFWVLLNHYYAAAGKSIVGNIEPALPTRFCNAASIEPTLTFASYDMQRELRGKLAKSKPHTSSVDTLDGPSRDTTSSTIRCEQLAHSEALFFCVSTTVVSPWPRCLY
jgi:hypothetical protein